MRKSLLAIWLVLPLGAWAYHEGPGQDLMRLDDVAGLLREARGLAADQQWVDACQKFDDALKKLPAEGHVRAARQIRIERDRAQMEAKQLPRAHADLQELVDEMVADPAADSALLAEARRALASSQYYVTWLMRLEGLPREVWEPEIEASRQTYRLLAEDAEKAGDHDAEQRCREDLEAAIRLSRLELKDLQGLPLPSQ